MVGGWRGRLRNQLRQSAEVQQGEDAGVQGGYTGFVGEAVVGVFGGLQGSAGEAAGVRYLGRGAAGACSGVQCQYNGRWGVLYHVGISILSNFLRSSVRGHPAGTIL